MDVLVQYWAELKELAMKIMYKMAMALGMKAADMNVLFDDGTQRKEWIITLLVTAEPP